MKKIIQITCLIILIVGITGCFGKSKECKATKDEHKFMEEYESLNGKKSEDGKKYRSIEIGENTSIKYSDINQTIQFLKEGTGVVYFGFPECPWCRGALPVFFEVAKDYSPCEILYFNDTEIRDQKELKNGSIVTKKEGTKEYKEILELLGDYADVYEGLEDDSIKRLYFPTMVFVKNGEIVGTHMATVDSQEDPYTELTKSQKKELKATYKDLFEKVKANMCVKKAC